jgi:hypothetical protein
MFEKSGIVETAEKFVYEVDKEAYENFAGMKDTMNTADIFKKYESLFSKDNIESIKKALASGKSGDDTARGLRYLSRFITEGYMENDVRELADKIATKSSQATIKVDGKDVAFRFSSVMIMNEDDREKRLSIDRARDPVILDLNVLMKKRLERIYELSGSLGYGNYLELYKDMKGIDFVGFSRLLDGFLKDTESIYTDNLGKYLETIGVDIKGAEKTDVSYLFRAKKYDPYFKKEFALETLKKTLSGMGIELDGQKNIKLDLEERPKKSPRAFCMPMKVPDEVYLVTMPRGGQDDYQALLHESGHAEHFANTKPELSFEYKHLGDISVSETYAFLFHYLTTDSNWLSCYIGMRGDDMAEYLRFVFFNKLYMLRRYSAKLRYEIELHTGGFGKGDALYSRHLGEVLKFRHPPHHYLSDLDDGFYSSQYLRAWVFEAQLRAALKEDFGEKWFLNKETKEKLMELYGLGEKYSVEELAQRVGYNGLDTKPLVEEIALVLKA